MDRLPRGRRRAAGADGPVDGPLRPLAEGVPAGLSRRPDPARRGHVRAPRGGDAAWHGDPGLERLRPDSSHGPQRVAATTSQALRRFQDDRAAPGPVRPAGHPPDGRRRAALLSQEAAFGRRSVT